MSASKYSYRTEVKTEQITLEWIIQNFSLLLEDKGKSIRSPVFHSESKKEKWYIKFYPRGRKDSADGYSSLYLYLRCGELPVKVQYELSIIHSETVVRKRMSIYEYRKRCGTGYAQFIARSCLLDLAGDTFTIFCKIDKPLKNILTSLSNPSMAITQELSVNTETGGLIENFAELLENSKFSDVTIIVKDKKFPAHKLVLATRSPVFAAMFQDREMNENKGNVIEIKKMEPSVVKGMLEFIYTDKISNFDEISNGLLPAADKYDLVRLRALCEKHLAKTLSTETAAELLVLADFHHCDNLKNYVMHFINNHLADIIDTESYKGMEENYPGLVKELFRLTAVQKKLKS